MPGLLDWFLIGVAAGTVSNHFKQKRIGGENLARKVIVAAAQNDPHTCEEALNDSGGNWTEIASPDVWWFVARKAASEISECKTGHRSADNVPSYDLIYSWCRKL